MAGKLKKLFSLSFNEIVILTKDIIFTRHDENITRIIRLVRKLPVDNISQKIILDIGAFDGKTSIQLSKAFPDCPIQAFEPYPKSFNQAKINCAGYENIVLYNIAISDKSGEAEMNITVNQVSSSLNSIDEQELESYNRGELMVKEKVKIATKSLDALKIEEEILILKIDVQGHEKEVLSGAKITLKNVYTVLVEMNNHSIYSGSSKYYEVDLLLRENNFRLADIIITYRKNGILVAEYDAIYINSRYFPL